MNESLICAAIIYGLKERDSDPPICGNITIAQEVLDLASAIEKERDKRAAKAHQAMLDKIEEQQFKAAFPNG